MISKPNPCFWFTSLYIKTFYIENMWLYGIDNSPKMRQYNEKSSFPLYTQNISFHPFLQCETFMQIPGEPSAHNPHKMQTYYIFVFATMCIKKYFLCRKTHFTRIVIQLELVSMKKKIPLKKGKILFSSFYLNFSKFNCF